MARISFAARWELFDRGSSPRIFIYASERHDTCTGAGAAHPFARKLASCNILFNKLELRMPRLMSWSIFEKTVVASGCSFKLWLDTGKSSSLLSFDVCLADLTFLNRNQTQGESVVLHSTRIMHARR